MGSIAQSNFLQALGWAVLNSLWQMAFLWVAYQLLAALFVKRASARNSLSTLLLFAGFAWFVFTFVGLLKDRVDAPFNVFEALMVNDQLNEWLFTALPFASLLYLAFLTLPLLHFIRNYRYVRIIREQGLVRPSASLRLFVKNISAQMEVGKHVQVWLSGFVSSPVTIGYLKPIVLLPIAALNHLSTSQIEAILLHELAHIRRFDYLFNLTVRFIQAILYFNPFVRAFARIIERERENSCDQMVMQFQYEPHAYASALLTLEQQAQHMELLLIPAFTGKKSELLMRIEAILGINQSSKFSRSRLAGFAGGAMACCFFFLLMLMSQPGHFRALHPGTTWFVRYLSYQEPETGDRPASAGFRLRRNENGIPVTEQPSIITHAVTESGSAPRTSAESSGDLAIVNAPVTGLTDPQLIQVALRSALPQARASLNNSQEKQVKEAMEISKRVLEEMKWKDVEKGIADAMTLAQKEMAKQEFMQKTNQLNWKKMEENLKVAYDKIDWVEIKKNLNTAMIEIKLDSVQHVYDMALSGLNELQKELDQNGVEAIPDTDVTIDAVKKKQAEVKVAVKKLTAVRAKKIVQL